MYEYIRYQLFWHSIIKIFDILSGIVIGCVKYKLVKE